MALKLTCPHCGRRMSLDEPFPMPGQVLKCDACAQELTMTYPDGVIEKLKAKGKRFQDDDAFGPPRAPQPPRPDSAPRKRKVVEKLDQAPPQRSVEELDRGPGAVPFAFEDPAAVRAFNERKAPQPLGWDPPTSGTEVGTQAATRADDDRTLVAGEEATYAGVERTVPSSRRPDGSHPADHSRPGVAAREQDPTVRQLAGPSETDATEQVREDAPMSKPEKKRKKAAAQPPAKRKRSWGGCLMRLGLIGLIGGGLVGGGGAAGAYFYYAGQLPTADTLNEYKPPAVTEVYDHDGELIGEIYEQRRYVVPLEEIPEHMQQAFLAAEDQDFWTHGGVDWFGLIRATLNMATGGDTQGASTITMQVTRNFLLTRDRTVARKIKEIILAQRLEDTYSKEHILYLYLNEIYLGSGAYGVEAAARIYFGKNIKDVSIAEAAMIAGLAPAPSTYSPHRDFKKAHTRQGYVLSRMRSEGFITDEQYEAAKAEDVKIVKEPNPFLTKAPHFTEYVRRYLVDTYGHEAVYQQGLRVTTTCDMDLQALAQKAVTEGVYDVDQRMGFRQEKVEASPRRRGVMGRPDYDEKYTYERPPIEVLGDDAAITARRDLHDKLIREAMAFEADPAGRVEVPAQSTLVQGRFYKGVVLEADRNWARVGIGIHEAILPLSTHKWVYEPNPKRSWRYRDENDLRERLSKGMVVELRVDTLDTTSDSDFKRTPGESKKLVGAHLWQEPEVDAALLSYDVATGAVRAMVGGGNYEKSEFNRAIQAKRQVGSTFKPIVYAAAIESQKFTSASIVADAPLALAATTAEFVWKPANYGNDYLGNLTLRKALALSRNTCTVRVLEGMDPGMNDDVIYSFARRLGIGGPPLHTLPEDHVPKPDNDLLCPWVRETKDSTICMDRYPPKDPNLTNTAHRRQLGPDDEYWCRACDLSMGLGSASLTMEELARAYSAFASGGSLVEPYYIEQVTDRDGKVLEKYEGVEKSQVIEPEVASIATWLLQGVVQGGTAAQASQLGVQLAGKTGTTNDEKDAWFVGFSNDVITAVWVGYDTPRSLGVSSTGGRTALPIWMEYMKVAAPKENDRPFPMRGNIQWAQVDEATGRVVSSGGRSYPFLDGTVPERTGVAVGEVSASDLATEL